MRLPHILKAPRLLHSLSSPTQMPKRDKLVVIMGATGCGKSRLSIDIATHMQTQTCEVINSDKIQLYRGLDITTNKIPPRDRRHVPHHLLGLLPPTSPDLSPAHFRLLATSALSSIVSRRHVPLLVGGSNSLVHAFLAQNYRPGVDPFCGDYFNGERGGFFDVRYECCFLWVDVGEKVLEEYLERRVDDMLDSGMVDELREFYAPGGLHELTRRGAGLRRAIGVPEFEEYFIGRGRGGDRVREGAYEEAVREIKENTCVLARRQVEKIQRLRDGGWGLHRLDGSDSFKAVLEGSESWSDVWESQVVLPSVKIVKRFLEEETTHSRVQVSE